MIESMEKVEYQARRKCTGTYRGAAREKVLAIAGVEPLDVKLDSMQARWLARTIQNLAAAGKLLPVSWGGPATMRTKMLTALQPHHPYRDHEDEQTQSLS